MPVDEALIIAELQEMITPASVEELSMKKLMKALKAKFGEGVREQKPWISEQVTSIVKKLSAAKETGEGQPAKTTTEQNATEEPSSEQAVAPESSKEQKVAAAAGPAAEPKPEPSAHDSLVVGGVALEGVWISSAGKATLVCKGRTVTFVSSGKTYALSFSEDKGCQMDGWTLISEQSNASTLRWEKEDGVITWEFEGTVDEAPPIGGGASPAPVRDATATRSKRKRKSVDYVAMNRRMKGLGSGGGGGGGGSGGGGLSSLMQAQVDDDDDDGDVDAKELEMAEKRRKFAEKPLADATAVAAAGQALEKIKGEPAMIAVLLKRLESYPMDLPTLRSSGIAKAVKPFRKHSDADIAGRASTLFKSWKAVAAAAGVQ